MPEQNNYAGIGATNNSPAGKGAWFKTPHEGVRAQVQHLYAYASDKPLPAGSICADPRFGLVKRGCAQNWEDLNGKWAVPGVGYGEAILKIYGAMAKFAGELTPEAAAPSAVSASAVEAAIDFVNPLIRDSY